MHVRAKNVRVLLWYLVSFAGIILNKSILSPGRHDADNVPLAVLALVHMMSTVVFMHLRQGYDRSFAIRPIQTVFQSARERKHILLLGLLRFLVIIAGLISLSFVAASFSETVKASSPIFTVAAAWLLTGERTPLPVQMTLVPIIVGLAVAVKGELSFTVVGFTAAIVLNCLECVQNVQCSSLIRKKCLFSSSELQYYTTLSALVVLFPFAVVRFIGGDLPLPSQAQTWGMLIGAGMVYYLQSALAFSLMSHYSPVTMSVLNTAKRALIICCSSLYFGNIITCTTMFGTVVTLLGSALYSAQKNMSGRYVKSMPPEAESVQTTAAGAAKRKTPRARGGSFAGRYGRCRLRLPAHRGTHCVAWMSMSVITPLVLRHQVNNERPGNNPTCCWSMPMPCYRKDAGIDNGVLSLGKRPPAWSIQRPFVMKGTALGR